MKSLIKRYIILWMLVLVTYNIVVLLIQYMIPSLAMYRDSAIQTAKNLIISTESIPNDIKNTATKGLLNYQSTIYGVVSFNILMIIQLVFFILTSKNIKDENDMLLSFPFLSLSRKFLVLTIIMCLIFSLIRNIPTFIAIIISLLFVIYMFIQYNKYFLQKEYVEDLEKRNKERKSKKYEKRI